MSINKLFKSKFFLVIEMSAQVLEEAWKQITDIFKEKHLKYLD